MTQSIFKGLRYVSVLTLLFIMSSCDWILQYPDSDHVDTPSIKTRVELSIDFTPINDPLVTSYADSRGGDFSVRYQVAVYAASGSQAGRMAGHKVWTSDVLQSGPATVITEMGLHAERYDVYAWVDFVPRGTSDDYHYVTSDLRKVELADPNAWGTDTRDAFSGKTSADLTRYRDAEAADVTVPVKMERPFGKFKIQTTDVSKFLDSYRPLGTYTDIIPAQTHLLYTCYFPTSYNQDTRLAHTEDFSLGVNHVTQVTEMDEHEAVLSSNYVLVCNDNTTVTADFEVKNAQGQHLATVRNITIPIRRNRLTIIKGEFLTAGVSGGAVIVPEFDGNHNIPI